MNPIAEEMMSYYGLCDYVEDSLLHYGMPRRSGRYPWGSGDNPYQHAVDFIGRVEEKRKSGFTYVDNDGKLWTGDNAAEWSHLAAAAPMTLSLSVSGFTFVGQ